MADISNWISKPVTDSRFIELSKKISKFNIVDGPWIAGGCVRKLWEGIEWIYEDVDIFFSNRKNFKDILNNTEIKYKHPKVSNNIFDELNLTDQNPLHVLLKSTPQHSRNTIIVSTYETDNAITLKLSGLVDIFGHSQDIDVQFISRSFPKSVNELFSDFDWTVCQFVSDGVTMWATPEAVRDLENHKLQIVTNTTRPLTYNRLVKYLAYGFDANDEIMLKMMEFLTTGVGDGVEDDYK